MSEAPYRDSAIGARIDGLELSFAEALVPVPRPIWAELPGRTFVHLHKLDGVRLTLAARSREDRAALAEYADSLEAMIAALQRAVPEAPLVLQRHVVIAEEARYHHTRRTAARHVLRAARDTLLRGLAGRHLRARTLVAKAAAILGWSGEVEGDWDGQAWCAVRTGDVPFDLGVELPRHAGLPKFRAVAGAPRGVEPFGTSVQGTGREAKLVGGSGEASIRAVLCGHALEAFLRLGGWISVSAARVSLSWTGMGEGPELTDALTIVRAAQRGPLALWLQRALAAHAVNAPGAGR